MSVYDDGLTIGGTDVNPIEVLVKTNAGAIEGTVTGPDGKPVSAVTVVMAPAATRRKNPALYKMFRSDAQGRFVIPAVAPGAYKVFAWENVPAGAWQNAEFLSRYEQHGAAVNVTPGNTNTVAVGMIRDEPR
jgi:hypothetical protein